MTRPTRLDAHPSVVAVRAAPAPARPEVLDAEWLRALCLDAGADDVGFVEISRPALADQVADITAAFPHPAALISFVCHQPGGRPLAGPIDREPGVVEARFWLFGDSAYAAFERALT